MSNEITAGKKCDVCGLGITYEETCYVWFRRFVKVTCCSIAICRTKPLCLICKNYIDIENNYGNPLTYFKHILSHYGLNEDYFMNINSVTYTVNNIYITPTSAYNRILQLLFVSVEGLTKRRYLELDDILCGLKDFTSSCSICKHSGVDTFYETFPTLEVVISHITKAHVDKADGFAGLPSLIDFIRNVNFY